MKIVITSPVSYLTVTNSFLQKQNENKRTSDWID